MTKSCKIKIMSATTKKKHVERELAEEYFLPKDHESIVQLIKPRGNNLHQVRTADGEEFLVSMPHKFRKHVWIKRGDFLLIEPIPEGNKVKAEIVRIILHDHIIHIKNNKLWPQEFEFEKEVVGSGENRDERQMQENEDESGESSDDEHLFENPNRKRVVYEETESESEESGDSSDAGD